MEVIALSEADLEKFRERCKGYTFETDIRKQYYYNRLRPNGLDWYSPKVIDFINLQTFAVLSVLIREGDDLGESFREGNG